MDRLAGKYRNDDLSAEELRRLRAEVNAMPDDGVEQQMYRAWMDGETETTPVDDKSLRRLKQRIDRSVGSRRIPAAALRWGGVAAAVLLPVFVALTIYFYHGTNLALTDEMVVSTGIGERAGVSLPDGTRVWLNAHSTLTYHPRSYHKGERRVKFDGEGYFHIFRVGGTPFRVYAEGLEVEVLGTIFNLRARDADDTAEITLEEGSVSLASTKSRRRVILQANRRALLDRRTGSIRVSEEKNIRDHSAWRRGDMTFRNTELSLVLKKIEDGYGVSVVMECKEYLDELFTGVLPAGNLNEALEVIEKSFHLRATTFDRQVRLVCR